MNELSNATSPYLLQHAHNPVQWRMWSPQTLADARASGKPILLSIGYAACHWCHVMAHESFEDADTAAVMNELFVNIKVDREERPDIDHIYMSALHALGQQGGWPLTMFLTPDAKPFWGGTFFPKVSRYGQPAFVTVLRSIERAFRTKPADVEGNAAAIIAHLERGEEPTRNSLIAEDLDALASRLVGAMDPVNGGLRGAPKFPNPQILEFLLRAARRSAVPHCRDLFLRAIERMSQGGIYDHLGGGYARYSTDDRWLVPHFEKMLYDNAQLLELLALAFRETGDPLFAERADETVAFVARELTNPDGSFCASLDADSEGEEGKFYVWTLDEIATVLGQEDASFFADAYDVAADGNWEDPHSGQQVVVLNRLRRARLDDAGEARLRSMRQRLFDARSLRVRPGLDDKVLADWNGLMIAALARSSALCGRPDWLNLAERAYHGVVEGRETEHGRLHHSRRGAVSLDQAFALDYAAMARAALALAEAGCNGRDYLADAAAFLERLLADHRIDESGLLAMNHRDDKDTIVRAAPTHDDAIPNSHAVALDALLRMAALSGDERWLTRADDLFDATTPAVLRNMTGHVGILNALDLRQRGATVAIAGPRADNLKAAALRLSFLERTVVDLQRKAASTLNAVERSQVEMAGSAGAAFVCRGTTCSPPCTDADALTLAVAGERSPDIAVEIAQ